VSGRRPSLDGTGPLVGFVDVAARLRRDGSPSEIVTFEPRDRERSAALMGFLASLTRLMIDGQVLVALRPRHPGFDYPLGSSLPSSYPSHETGAFLRFLLQRFSPSSIGTRLRAPALLSFGGASLLPTRGRVSSAPSSTSGFRSRRRSVGAGAPRSSPGVSVLQGVQSHRPPPLVSRPAVPLCALATSSGNRPKRQPALWGLVLRGDPLSSREGAFPHGLSNLVPVSIS